MNVAPDFGLRVAMPVAFLRSTLEQAVETITESTDVDAIGVHVTHLAPDPTAPVTEGHAAATAAWLARRGLAASTLNATGFTAFDPTGGPDALRTTSELIGHWLRIAAALGAPRLMIWDGVATTPDACSALGQSIELGRDASRLGAPVPISVELHPFTFALATDRVDELADTLRSIGDTGFCFDFAHCAVAYGPDFIARLPPAFFELVTEVHWCDSDAVSSELHFPPGDGVLDLETIEHSYAGKAIPVLWDLYGWPAPTEALARTAHLYSDTLERHRRSLVP